MRQTFNLVMIIVPSYVSFLIFHLAGTPSPYIGASYGFGAAFLVALLTLIVVVVVCSTCLCKYKCNRGNGGEGARLINRQD